MYKDFPKETDVFRDALREFLGLEPIVHKENKRKPNINNNFYSEVIDIRSLFPDTI